MNGVEASRKLMDIAKRLSAFSVVLSMEHSGIALTLNSLSSDLASIANDLVEDDEVYHGFDWIAIRDALSVVRPDLSLQIDRYLRGDAR